MLRQVHLEAYLQGRDEDTPFDAARLPAFLSCVRPANPGWFPARRVTPAVAGHETMAVLALRRLGLNPPRSIRPPLAAPRFRRAIDAYAASGGIGRAEVTHLGISLLLIGLQDPILLADYFPLEAGDLNLRAALAGK